MALLLAFAASYRRVVDTDIGWQMATGRYVIEQRHIPGTDVFSYTARGQEWIYPVGSGVIFHIAERIAGFAAITWIGVAACVGIVLLLLRSGATATAALALIAAHNIAYSTLPRANMFSTVLFTAFFFILWRYHRNSRAPLWVLPLLMVCWVNLHLGFFAGFAAMGGYVVLELTALPESRARLRRAVPWLAATAAATLLNPWGVRIYTAVARQQQILQTHSPFVTEWSAPQVRAAGALAWRTEAPFLWLVIAAGVALAIALRRKSFGSALLLAASIALALRYQRFHGMFAVITVIVAGAVLSQVRVRLSRPAAIVILAVAALFCGVRISDLVSDRYYVVMNEVATFGAGPTDWYPQRAADFILRERLPGRVFNAYDIGGYLIWRLGPAYPVYIDGRAIPFGADVFFRYMQLLGLPPGSPQWQREADLRGINMAVLPVSRFAGLAGVAKSFCETGSWRAVYLDETAGVFLRNRPENAPWLERLSLDCAHAALPSPPPEGNPGRVYNYYLNAGWLLHSLDRNAEALAMLERAERVFTDDQHLYLTRAAALMAAANAEAAARAAEQAIRLSDNPASRYALGVAQANQGRYTEAVENIGRAAESSGGRDIYRMLGDVLVAMRRPDDALRAFAEAERRSPYHGAAVVAGAGFRVQLESGRAQAWFQKGDLTNALRHQLLAVENAPWDAARWNELAELYEISGRKPEAEAARRRAAEVSAAP